MTEVLVSGAPPPAPWARRLTFHGSGAPLFGIFLRNLALSVVTLGIYYFWGKVRARRYILGHAEFEGDRFGYHATGKELLLGWLKVAGFFAWVYVMQIVIPLLWRNPFAGVVVGLVFYAVFLVVYPIAVVGSRRFRLSRTSWRGIRFSFRGRARDFLRLYVGGSMLSVLTLGFFYAYFQNNIRRFLITHSHFGSTRFGYDGRGGDLLGLYILAAVVYGAALMAVFLIIGFVISPFFVFLFMPVADGLPAFRIPITVGLLIAAVAVWSIFLIRRWRGSWRDLPYGARARPLVLNLFLAVGSLVGLGGGLNLLLSPTFVKGPPYPLTQVFFALLLAAPLLLGVSFFWFWFLATRHRYYWGRTTVATARFRSTVTAAKFYRLFAGDALRLIPTLGLAWPFVVVRHIRFTFANLVLEGPLDIETIHQEAQAASATGESLGEFFGLLDLDLGL